MDEINTPNSATRSVDKGHKSPSKLFKIDNTTNEEINEYIAYDAQL